MRGSIGAFVGVQEIVPPPPGAQIKVIAMCQPGEPGFKNCPPSVTPDSSQ